MVLIIKKKIAAVLVAALFVMLNPAAAAAGAPEISARNAIVMNGAGQVIFEKDADERALIASTTKLMTALVVLENTTLDELVEIKPEYCGIEGSSMYLKAGEKYTVRELLLGLLLASGNDAAVALAGYTAGSTEEFVALMNSRAKTLGMSGSSFKNPHGLDTEGHFSTARDMAKLMCCCMEKAAFRELCGRRSAEIAGQTLANHNRLLWECEGCVAGKTGYTQAAGRCLVSCCERGGTRFICVTLSAPDDWNDHKKLYAWAYDNYTMKNVMEDIAFDIPVISGSRETVKIAPAEEMLLFLPTTTEVKLTAEMPRFVFAPVQAGEAAGKIWVIIGDDIIGSCELIYTDNVPLAVKCRTEEPAAETTT